MPARSTKRFWADLRGAAMIEYTLLITLVAACLLVSVTAIAIWTDERWDSFRSAVAASTAAKSGGEAGVASSASVGQPAAMAASGSGGDAGTAAANGDRGESTTGGEAAATGGAGGEEAAVATTNGNGNGNNGNGKGNGGANGAWSGGSENSKAKGRCGRC